MKNGRRPLKGMFLFAGVLAGEGFSEKEECAGSKKRGGIGVLPSM